MARRGQAVSKRRRAKSRETDPGLEPDEIDHGRFFFFFYDASFLK